MKILTWNCNGALWKKFELLTEFAADIVVIQECENPGTSKNEQYKAWAANGFWTGENQKRGLGIFARDGINLSKHDWDTDGLKYFISCRVNNNFNIVAVWCYGNTPDYPYIGQFWKYMEANKMKFEDCILAGDFNSNKFWDKPRRTWNHSDVVRELGDLNIESFYHLDRKEEQGKETAPTFYLYRDLSKPYHLDYIFGSEAFCRRLKHVSVGQPGKWLEQSDHMPVVGDIG